MKLIKTSIPGLLVFEPKKYSDARGFFFESYNKKVLKELAGIDRDFVQDNHSGSVRNALRGLHYQIRSPQAKLVRAIRGTVWDVAVDLRKQSATFGRWEGFELSAENGRIAWIPEGFAHGFLVLSDYAEFLYKVTDYYLPHDERCMKWDDPELAIDWPIRGEPIVSARDRNGQPFHFAEKFP
jgi:dTDP-4-dehydrorhamnose 3,5-epimerase